MRWVGLIFQWRFGAEQLPGETGRCEKSLVRCDGCTRPRIMISGFGRRIEEREMLVKNSARAVRIHSPVPERHKDFCAHLCIICDPSARRVSEDRTGTFFTDLLLGSTFHGLKSRCFARGLPLTVHEIKSPCWARPVPRVSVMGSVRTY